MHDRRPVRESQSVSLFWRFVAHAVTASRDTFWYQIGTTLTAPNFNHLQAAPASSKNGDFAPLRCRPYTAY